MIARPYVIVSGPASSNLVPFWGSDLLSVTITDQVVLAHAFEAIEDGIVFHPYFGEQLGGVLFRHRYSSFGSSLRGLRRPSQRRS